MNKTDLLLIQFDISGKFERIDCVNSGNINKTYLVTYKEKNRKKSRYILQKINTTVFKEPYILMRNIENVTNWIKEKSLLTNDNHPSLVVIKTKNGDPLATIKDENGEREYYRLYNCIDNSISYNVTNDLNVIYNVGKAFGHFQKMLIDFPIDKLEETIKDFHNTVKRYDNFLKDVNLDVCNRAKEVTEEIQFIKDNRACASKIIDLMDKGLIPVRVTHNDTKINNVMMDKKTGEYLTVIDLDTVMLGSSLYDYGDGVRAAAATSFEDEKDLRKVSINKSLFEKYTEGYLSEMGKHLTKDEVKNMGSAIEVITYELALRFLNDYINGDTYFKTTYKKHNLVRARNQIKLLKDIQSNMEYINNFNEKTYKKVLQK